MEAVRTPLRERGIVSKPKMRTRLASLNFSEKIKILEKLRERERAIAASGLKAKPERKLRKGVKSEERL